MTQTYCDAAPGHEWHGPYHEREYGFPLEGDAELFERLVLEINQAGLSWLTILRKRPAFQQAYDGFDPEVVAAYGEADRNRLLADPAPTAPSLAGWPRITPAARRSGSSSSSRLFASPEARSWASS
jgi:hypothetical protein